MKTRVDFYSMHEAAIQISYSSRRSDEIDLIMFVLFSFRTFDNFGNHPVAKDLAVALYTFDKEKISQLNEGLYEPPGPAYIGLLSGFTELSLGTNYETFHQALANMPQLVNHRGEGEKSFTLHTTPFRFDIKGFGFLGKSINFYAFHATIALFRYLASSQSSNEVFINRLLDITKFIAKNASTIRLPLGSEAAFSYAKTLVKELKGKSQ